MGALNLVVAFALAVLAGLGVGSGGLYILFLTEILSLPHGQATLGNLLFFVAAVISAVCIRIRGKRLDYPFLLQILLFGAPGAYLGFLLSQNLPREVLRIILGVFLIASGILSLYNGKKGEKKKREPQKQNQGG